MDNIIEHIINVGLGEINTNSNGKQLKSIIIYGKTYRCNKDKPLTKLTKPKLYNIEGTSNYKASNLVKTISDKTKVSMALRKYAITQKATITEEQSAFKFYVNLCSTYNINLK